MEQKKKVYINLYKYTYYLQVHKNSKFYVLTVGLCVLMQEYDC